MGTNRSIAYIKAKKSFSNHASMIESWKGTKVVRKVSKIDPELKSRWVSTLRSGNYKQGQGNLKVALYDGTCEHCCLGVLCELIAPEGFEPPPSYGGVVSHTFSGKSNQDQYPNRDKMIELGLMPSSFKYLAMMNDGDNQYDYKKKRRNNIHKHNFNQIADYIEKNL